MRMRVRSSILEMLAQQTADQLVTVEGKAALKTAIIERASEKAEELKITDVLFSEFIVQ
jgi:flagellar basal body-associated protein FliL